MDEYRYYVLDYEITEDAVAFKSARIWRNYDTSMNHAIFHEAARHFHSYRGGFDVYDHWPLTFVILDKDGNELGRARVDRTLIVNAEFSVIEAEGMATQ